MATHNHTEEKLLEMYERIGMGTCPSCRNCHGAITNLSPPVTAWGVGNNFCNESKKILFVGKNARGYNQNPKSFHFHEAFDDGRWLWEPENWHKTWGTWASAYWTYTREITKKIFGDYSFEHIAFTNIVKCNNSLGKDTTPDLVKDNCIKKLKVFSGEVKAIRPTHIIFYTNWYYDDYIRDAFDTFNVSSGTKQIGKKYVKWDSGKATIDGVNFCVLVTGHPERLKKDEFTNAVCSWVKTTQA